MRIPLSLSLVATVVYGMFPTSQAASVTYAQIRWVTDPQAFISYGATDRDLRVELLGRPFAAARTEIEQAVVAGMQAANAGPGTRFTTHPGASAMPDFRVVVSFEPVPNVPALCGAAVADRQTSETGSSGEVVAVLCDKDKPITSTTGSLSGVSRADDLSDLMKHVTLDLFPGQNPWRG